MVTDILQTAATCMATIGGFEAVKWLYLGRSERRIADARASQEETSAKSIREKNLEESLNVLSRQIADNNEQYVAQAKQIHELTAAKLQLAERIATLESDFNRFKCYRPACNSRQRIAPS